MIPTPPRLLPKAVTDFMYQYGGRVTRAVERCNYVADCERVLGYTESAAMYKDMADEITVTRAWVSEQLTILVQSDA